MPVRLRFAAWLSKFGATQEQTFAMAAAAVQKTNSTCTMTQAVTASVFCQLKTNGRITMFAMVQRVHASPISLAIRVVWTAFCGLLLVIGFLSLSGCATRKQVEMPSPSCAAELESADRFQPVAYVRDTAGQPTLSTPVPQPTATSADAAGSLEQLVADAQSSNPSLIRLRQEAAAALAKAGYAAKLPDPTVAANIFAEPIETAAGSQRANVMVMQMLPWLSRLNAQAQQAYLEAMAAEQLSEVQRLTVVGDVRALWYRLYVIGRQIETTEANQLLLKKLIEIASASVGVGRASASDVRMGTVEYSRLEERLLALNQQLSSTKAELNRLAGRPADWHIAVPKHIDVSLPEWSHAMLRQLAFENQPAIAAAQIQTQATLWGIEVARLKRRPDISLNASWFAMDDNRPPSTVVDVGRDAVAFGAQVSIPLWHQKFDAMQDEAAWKHAASHASVEEARLRFDSMLRELWEQARAAHETAKLYETTIIPEAMRTLRVDQASYQNGSVEFDRVIQDFRTVLTLEVGYHQAVGQLATALARIRQATGTELAIPETADDSTFIPFPPVEIPSEN